MVKFNKYKDWLQIQGYNVERIDKYAPPLQCYCYTFSNGTKYKYWVNVHCDRNLNVSNNIMSINYGWGTPYMGTIKSVKIDFRKKFWKEMLKD